ncbi:MAG: 4'-phosphopantetheinyl transferase superfamily protein [Eubacteriales bacterium]
MCVPLATPAARCSRSPQGFCCTQSSANKRAFRFERGRRGKPHLVDHTPFNITHAGIMPCSSSAQPVGVDLERFRPIDWRRISERFFHPIERAYLTKSTEPERDFFRIWTLKESYLKAGGNRIFCFAR